MNKVRTAISIIQIAAYLCMIVVLGIAVIVFSGLALSYTTDIGLTIATLLLALIAFLNLITSIALGNAIPKINETIVQPFIFVRGSYKTERERAARKGQLSNDHINQGGIWLQNIGPGHAIKGTISLLTDGGEVKLLEGDDKYSFDRIPPGWVYMYPSLRCPKLGDELKKLKKPDTDVPVGKIRLKIEYYDIQGRKYRLPKDEQEINLVEPVGAFTGTTIQDEAMGLLGKLLMNLPDENPSEKAEAGTGDEKKPASQSDAENRSPSTGNTTPRDNASSIVKKEEASKS